MLARPSDASTNGAVLLTRGAAPSLCSARSGCSVRPWAAGQHDVACRTWLHHDPAAPASSPTPLIPAPTPNFACNSPATISNLEFTTLELQRFQTLLKLHPIELHATFLGECPGIIPGHRSQALGNSPISSVGIHRSHPQALFPSGSYPQGFVSAWITLLHGRSVFVDGPTRGPTKE